MNFTIEILPKDHDRRPYLLEQRLANVTCGEITLIYLIALKQSGEIITFPPMHVLIEPTLKQRIREELITAYKAHLEKK